MRPGFGLRHPAVASLLASEDAAASRHVDWLNGALPLRVSAYTSVGKELPDELLTSIRCLVSVEDRIVMCETRDGDLHICPGGHRIDGESFVQTAVRELHEETGWFLRPESVRTLGWLHFEHVNDTAIDPSFPYPDFLQLVMCGTATERDGGRDVDWTDIEGFEVASRLVTIAEARTSVSNELLDLVYLDIMLESSPLDR